MNSKSNFWMNLKLKDDSVKETKWCFPYFISIFIISKLYLVIWMGPKKGKKDTGVDEDADKV